MHNHQGQLGPPYEHDRPITCEGCKEEILAYRAALCERYGWKSWPEDISVAKF